MISAGRRTGWCCTTFSQFWEKGRRGFGLWRVAYLVFWRGVGYSEGQCCVVGAAGAKETQPGEAKGRSYAGRLRRYAGAGEGMEITIWAAQVNAQEIVIDERIALQEVRLSGTGIRLEAGPRGPVRIAELSGTVVVTEASLNRLLKEKPPEGTRDVELATLTGRIR